MLVTRTTHPEEDTKIGETVVGGEEFKIEEPDITAVGGPTVAGVASGSPTKGVG